MIIGLGTSRHARALSLTLAGGMVGALALTVPASAQPAPVAARPAAAAPSAVRTAAPAATFETGSVSARLQFGSGSAVLTGTAKAALAALVASLPAPAVVTTVTVDGYVQRTSNTANDLALSFARARAAASYLKALGVGGVYAVAGLRVGGSGASARAAAVVIAYRIPRPQTLTFTTPTPIKVGAANQRLVVRSSVGLPVVVRSITPAVCTVIPSSGGFYLHAVAAGVCSLRAVQAGSSWYFPAYASAAVRISPARGPQTIRFAQPADMRRGDADRALSVTATSGLPVTVVATSTPLISVRPAGIDLTVCTVVGTPGHYTVHAGGPGVCTLTATQAGNASFYAAPKVVRTFDVVMPPRPQTITFVAPIDMIVGDVDQALEATATSSLVVSVTSTTLGVCTVVDGAVHAVSAGTCSLTASQAGNSSYAAATDVVRTFSVLGAVQSISFTQPDPIRVGDADQALTASATSSLPVTISSTTLGTCTIVSGKLHAVAAGSCVLRATQAGNGLWAAATAVERTVSVSAALLSQTISFTQPTALAVADADETLTTSATSSLPVTVASTTLGVCTIVSGKLNAVSAGTCSLTASQAGDSTYSPAPDVVRTVTISGQAQTISFTQPTALAVADADETLTASATSSLPVTVTSTTLGVCTIVSGKLHAVSAGTCSLTASQGGNSLWAAAANVVRTVTINGQAQTISFTQPAALAVADADETLTASATSSLSVTITSTTLAVCTIVSGELHAVTAGTCSLTASQAGNSLWAAAPDVVRTVTINGQAQTIDFTQPADIRVGDPDGALTASASSGLDVTLGTSTPEVCSVVSGAVRALAPGECILTADQGGSSLWAAAPTVTRTITVRAALATQEIFFQQPSDLTVGQGGQPLFFIASSHLDVTVVSESPEVCEVSGMAVLPVGAGTCTLTASQPGDLDFAAAPDVVRQFSVFGAFQEINFNAPHNQYVDDPGQTLVASATSGLPVTFYTQTPQVCDVLGDVLVPLTAGRCAIVATQNGNSLWAAAGAHSWGFDLWEPRTSQSISFTQPAAMLMTDDPQGLTASASSGLDVSITSDTPAVCSTNGVIVAVAGEGTCSLTARQAGNVTWAPAPAVTRTFPVSRTTQTIDFRPPFGMTVGGLEQMLDAFSDSGLPVTLTSNDLSVCTVSGGAVHAVGKGTCSITASQAGDATFAPADDVTDLFAVYGQDQVINATTPSTMAVGDPDQTLVATADSGLAVTFASTSPDVCTVVDGKIHAVSIGTCTLHATQEGNAQWNAATPADVSSSITGHLQTVDGDVPAPIAVGDPDEAIVAWATSGLAVTLTSTTPDVCTVVSGPKLHAVTAGECHIQVHQPGDLHYAPSDTIELITQITGQAQSISFTQPSALAVAGADEALTYSATSGLDVTITSTTLDVCTIVAGQLHAVTAGTCSLTASQGGDSLWAVAPEVTHTVVISGQAQTVEFTAPADMTFGDADQAVTTETTSPLAVALTSDTPAICDIVDGKIHALAGGTCTVTASQAGSPLWAPATPVSHSITIAKATQGITFAAPADMPVNAPDQLLSATSNSGLDVTVTSTTPITCDVVAGAVHPLAMGLCSLRAAQAGSAQYLAASSVTRSITITTRTLTDQVITFATPADVTLGLEPPQALSVSSGSGLAVDVSSLTTDTCTVSNVDGTFYATALATGACILEATQGGDADFNPAVPVDVTFTISDGGGGGGPVCPPDCGAQPQEQTIDFPLPHMMALGEIQQMGALASSGLDVVYSSVTPVICDVDNTGIVTGLGVGTCMILADQGGDASYSPAATASVSFEVIDSV